MYIFAIFSAIFVVRGIAALGVIEAIVEVLAQNVDCSK